MDTGELSEVIQPSDRTAVPVNIPFSSLITGSRDLKLTLTGPTVPAAVRWLINTVFMAIMSMILTCITASMAGYALAKKRFVGRQLLFHIDRMRNGITKTGYFDPITS